MIEKTLRLDGRATFYSGSSVSELIPWLVRVSDFLICVLGFIALPQLFNLITYSILYDVQSYFYFGLIFGLFFVIYSEINGLYKFQAVLNMTVQSKGICVSWFFSWVFFILTAFALKTSADFSRLLITMMMVTGAPVIILGRLSSKFWLARAYQKGIIRKEYVHVITIGEPDHFRDQLNKRYAVIGAQSIDPDNLLTISGDFLNSLSDPRLEKLVIALPFENMNLTPSIIKLLRHSSLPVLVMTDGWLSTFIPGFAEQTRANIVDNITVFELCKPPMSVVERLIKRGFDILFSAFSLVFLGPIIVIVAIAVKIDSDGPVFFRQKRLGFNNRAFSILKFRSMTVMEDGTTVTQAKKRDQRVTRVGKIIRATSLDELPQLLNVLAGQMSIVGPRPHALAHDRYYGDLIKDYSRRRHMKPGLTGWAQVNGFRGETSDIQLMEARVEHDLWYIQNWSLWLDIWIIFRTIRELFRNQNVY